MVAILEFAPIHGVSTTAEAITRLDTLVTATVRAQAGLRPKLVCHWTQSPDGRLSCHWDCEVPGDIPIPPD